MLWLHYEDLVQDLPAAIRLIAEFLGIGADDPGAQRRIACARMRACVLRPRAFVPLADPHPPPSRPSLPPAELQALAVRQASLESMKAHPTK